MNLKQYQSGVGLIEVLIAALVFAVGITAAVQLQAVFFQNTSSANARSIAMGLAQERLEQQRNFLDVATYQAIQSSTANESIPQGNTTFARSWVVTNYYHDPVNNSLCHITPLSTFPTGKDIGNNNCNNVVVSDIDSNGSITVADWIPEQKRILVSVTWTDPDGSAQAVNLEGVINSNSGASAGSIIADAGGGGGSGESPIVPYTPSTDVQVTPIGVGDTTKRETLVPSSSTVDGYSRTRFIANTYKTGTTNQLVRQEEFQNVACDCRFNGVSTEEVPTYAAAHPAWDNASNSYKDIDGEKIVGKAKGCVQGGGNNCASNPEPLCDACCRDHHDSTDTVRKYDPYRSSDDYTSGNHNHYLGTNVVTSGRYLESCRMKRVNGFWRVYQDWHLIDFTVMPVTDLENATIKQAYADYVADLAAAHIEQGIVDGQSSISNPPTKPTEIDHTVPDNYINMNVGQKSYLSARAVYLDYMDSEHLTKVQEMQANNQEFLLHVPFYEIEVAPVATWASANTALKVGPYDGPGNTNDLISGELHALTTNTNAIEVTGTIKKSNSGIVALNSAVDYNASINPDSETLSSDVHVCIGCTTAAPSGSCSLPWGGTIENTQSVNAYQYQTRPTQAECDSAMQSRTCTNGVLSGSYVNQSCTVSTAPTTCTTTINGTAPNTSQSISISVNGALSSASCTYTGSGNKITYSCTAVTTALDAVITVTRHNTTLTLSSICGSQTVNF